MSRLLKEISVIFYVFVCSFSVSVLLIWSQAAGQEVSVCCVASIADMSVGVNQTLRIRKRSGLTLWRRFFTKTNGQLTGHE